MANLRHVSQGREEVGDMNLDAHRWLDQRDSSRENGDTLARSVASFLRGDTDAEDLAASLRRYRDREAPSLLGAKIPGD